jgi:hypothetical protein
MLGVYTKRQILPFSGAFSEILSYFYKIDFYISPIIQNQKISVADLRNNIKSHRGGRVNEKVRANSDLSNKTKKEPQQVL